MLKLVAIACIAAVASASVAIPSKSFVQSVHDDEWCHEHHLGSGAAACIKHNGCCFSDYVDGLFDNTQDLGPCHSCDAHSDDWCAMYGGEDTDSCLMNSGCTYDSETLSCKGVPGEGQSSVRTCYDSWLNYDDDVVAYRDCIAGAAEEADCDSLYVYKPECQVDGNGGEYYESNQADQDQIGEDAYFCVDENGHELPDTRKDTPLTIWSIDCDKLVKAGNGMQCPNAITLTTKGGVVIVNKDSNTEDCSVTCNTDKDCAGEDWCCFNGCGYSCQLPIKPMSGCAEVPGNPFQTVSGLEGDATHGVEIGLGCRDGFDVIPVDGPQDVVLTCKHGHWETLDGQRDYEHLVECQKSCAYYQVEGLSTLDGRPLRGRDYIVDGSDHFHSASVTVRCQPGYGVVDGTQRAKDESEEELTCNEGYWQNEFGNSRSIECHICYDAYEFEWRDEKGNDCTFYKSRPMECNENQGAVENCRVSCRSCLQAEEAHKVRNKIENLNDVPEDKRSNWKRVRELVANTYYRTRSVTVPVEVSVQLPMNQVCTDGQGSNIRMPAEGCPEGFAPMA